jgi:hypothetical protein
MKKIISGEQLGLVLCEMFGINPDNVRGIEVIARIGESASVTIETVPSFSDGWTMTQTFSLLEEE